MKQVTTLLFFILTFQLTNAQIVNIPDANFKAALVGNSSINTNNDGEIQVSEAEAYTGSISVINRSIQDLTGIGAFTNITGLDCSSNELTTLNLSNNTSLLELRCSRNDLIFLDLSDNTNLIRLYCGNNPLTSLDMRNGGNSDFTHFYAANNPNLSCIFVDNATWSNENWSSQINNEISTFVETEEQCNEVYVNILDANFKAVLLENSSINTNNDDEIQVGEAIAYQGSIDVSSQNIRTLKGIEAFTKITELNCQDNNLYSIDLSNNKELTGLYCAGNNLTSLNVSNNINLSKLYCHNNELTSIDLSNNINIRELWCGGNLLTHLDIRNETNANIVRFDTRGNENLSCITVDNATYSTTNWTNIDNTTTFSESAEECRVLSTDDDVDFGKVKVYPNPVIDLLTVKSNTTTIKKIEVYNLLGSKMLESKQSSISVNQLPKGIYILKIIGTENQQKNQRFIKL